MVDDRPSAILGQPLLDLPYQLLALLLVELVRLPVDQLVNFGIAIAVGVVLGPAGVGLVENLVGVSS